MNATVVGRLGPNAAFGRAAIDVATCGKPGGDGAELLGA